MTYAIYMKPIIIAKTGETIMPRPRKCRKVCSLPGNKEFVPATECANNPAIIVFVMAKRYIVIAAAARNIDADMAKIVVRQNNNESKEKVVFYK